LDPLELGPDGDQELYDTRTLLVGLGLRAAPAADLVAGLAGPTLGDRLLGILDLPVLDLLVGPLLRDLLLGFVLIMGGYLGLLDAVFSELIKRIL